MELLDAMPFLGRGKEKGVNQCFPLSQDDYKFWWTCSDINHQLMGLFCTPSHCLSGIRLLACQHCKHDLKETKIICKRISESETHLIRLTLRRSSRDFNMDSIRITRIEHVLGHQSQLIREFRVFEHICNIRVQKLRKI